MTTMAYGDGSIIERKDGRLEVRVLVDGKMRFDLIPARIVRANPNEARKLAERRRAELAGRRGDGLVDTSQTLGDFLSWWIGSLEGARRKRVATRTLDGYRMVVEKHIVPTLGRHRLDRLNERHVQAWIDADPTSPQTIAHHRAVLHRALNVAMRQRLVARNVAFGVELPPIPEYRGRPLELEEVRRLLDASAGDRWHALWALAIDTGWRESELLGLARADVDEAAGSATLTSQLQQVRGRGRIAKGERRQAEWIRVATKRPRTLATVSLSPYTCEAVRRHRVILAAERRPSDEWFGLLFVSITGIPIGSSEVARQFDRACDAAGIERRRFHDLRGSSATILRELGVPEDVRMSRLGHSTTKMARRYAQARPGSDRVAADALGRALGVGE